MTNRILIIVIGIFAVLLILSVSLTVLIASTPVFSFLHPEKTTETVAEPPQNTTPDEEPASSTEPETQVDETNTDLTVTDEPGADVTSTDVSATDALGLSDTPTPGVPQSSQTASQPNPTPQPPTPPSNTVTSSICDIPGPYTASIILEDSNTFEPPFGAELIRLVQVDTSKTIVVSLSSYLAVPATSLKQEYGILESTLGSVYHTVYQRTTQLDQRHASAAQAVNSAIAEAFDINPDFYISIDQSFLRLWIRFTGSVTVNNPEAFMAGETEFPAGSMELTPGNIWQFVTFSTGPSGEAARIARQDLALQALFTAVQTRKTLNELNTWLSDRESRIHTNLDSAQLVSTFCALSYSASGSLEYRQVPTEAMTVDGDRLHLTDPAQLTGLFQ